MTNEISPVGLAKKSVEYYLMHHRVMPVPAEIPAELRGQAGVFVSLKKAGQLRGCIGTFQSTRESIAAEIIYNAVSAATEDPRFWPVELEELPEIEVTVDILSAPEPVSSLAELDPHKYGVIVRHKTRSGLLLPDLEGVDTVEEQVSIAMQKAGIQADHQPVELYRFEVIRHK